MSFDWNLSDDEDGDNDFAEWTQKVGYRVDKDDDDDDDDEKMEEKAFGLTKSSPASAIPSFASLNHQYNRNKDDDDDDNDDDPDEDAVAWEDASNASDDRKPEASNEPVALRAIHIDLNQVDGATTTSSSNAAAAAAAAASSRSPKTRPRRISQFRIETLSPHLQSLIRNIHRSHLLTLTSRAIQMSHVCSDPTILAVAHSLIPEEWSLTEQSIRESDVTVSAVARKKCPSVETLHGFMAWYIEFVHGVRGRRETQRRRNIAAGAPNQRRSRAHKRKGDSLSVSVDTTGPSFVSTGDQLLWFASYLSITHDRDPQLLLEHITTMPIDRSYNELLLAMARSMGWRARFVQSIEPVALDLNVDHPLLANSSLYGKLFSEVGKSFKPVKRRGKTKDKVIVSSASTSTCEEYSFPTQPKTKVLDWVEILCADPQASSRQRWIHVDAVHKLVDRPDQVELLLGQGVQRNNTGGKKSSPRKRDVVAYVVGAEHSPSCWLDKYLVGSCVDECSGGNSTATIGLRLTDVTPRYSASWVDSLRKRGIVRSKKCSIEEKVRKSWWTKTLHQVNGSALKKLQLLTAKTGESSNDAISLDDNDESNSHPITDDKVDSAAEHESKELQSLADSEAIPTSKAAFATHPKFVIPSVLGKTEVLAPDASERVCGVFKGQLVYRREDVSSALTAKKWLYEGRKVRDDEMSLPVKRRNVRKKPTANGSAFKALRSYGVGESNDGDEQRQIQRGSTPLEDGMEDLYAVWQTNSWSPIPVGPQDKIPMNEFKNIELALLNPGLVHIDQTGLAAVAKKLAIPYAPCLLGFENGTGGSRTPMVRGIVVHQHNEQLVREAGIEVSHHAVEKEYQDRRQALLLHWKRLMVGLLTKERLDREYGTKDTNDE